MPPSLNSPTPPQSAQESNRLQLSLYKLNALLDYSSILNAEETPSLLMERFRQVIEQDLSINRILFIFKDAEGWQIMLNANIPEHLLQDIDLETELAPYTRTTVVSSSTRPFLREIDVVIPIMRNDKPHAYILLGDTNENYRGVSPIIKHLDFAQTLSSISFVALQNFELFKQAIHEERLQQQLKTAANLQQMLIPKAEKLPCIPGVTIATHYQPFYEIGGDYFDIVRLAPHMIGFCIADVSGKGIPAALLMTNFQANFRAQLNASTPLKAIVEQLNTRVSDATEDDAFITLFIGRYNTEQATLEYVNAGQTPPFLYNRVQGTLQTLTSGCAGLGMVDPLPRITTCKLRLTEETILFCYTDGLVECTRHGENVYSTAIIERALTHESTPAAVIADVHRVIEDEVSRGVREIFDDISMLVLGFEPSDPCPCPPTP